MLEALLRGGGGVCVKLREGEAPYPTLPHITGALDGAPGASEEIVEEEDVALLPAKSVLHAHQPPPWIAQVGITLEDKNKSPSCSEKLDQFSWLMFRTIHSPSIIDIV